MSKQSLSNSHIDSISCMIKTRNQTSPPQKASTPQQIILTHFRWLIKGNFFSFPSKGPTFLVPLQQVLVNGQSVRHIGLLTVPSRLCPLSLPPQFALISVWGGRLAFSLHPAVQELHHLEDGLQEVFSHCSPERMCNYRIKYMYLRGIMLFLQTATVPRGWFNNVLSFTESMISACWKCPASSAWVLC